MPHDPILEAQINLQDTQIKKLQLASVSLLGMIIAILDRLSDVEEELALMKGLPPKEEMQ